MNDGRKRNRFRTVWEVDSRELKFSAVFACYIITDVPLPAISAVPSRKESRYCRYVWGSLAIATLTFCQLQTTVTFWPSVAEAAPSTTWTSVCAVPTTRMRARHFRHGRWTETAHVQQLQLYVRVCRSVTTSGRLPFWFQARHAHLLNRRWQQKVQFFWCMSQPLSAHVKIDHLCCVSVKSFRRSMAERVLKHVGFKPPLAKSSENNWTYGAARNHTIPPLQPATLLFHLTPSATSIHVFLSHEVRRLSWVQRRD